MARKLEPEIAQSLGDVNVLVLGGAEILPMVKAVLALIRNGSKRRIEIEANDLNRFLLSDAGLVMADQRPSTFGAVAFAIKLLTMHANDSTPSAVPGRGASLALLAPPSVGGRARLDDEGA